MYSKSIIHLLFRGEANPESREECLLKSRLTWQAMRVKAEKLHQAIEGMNLGGKELHLKSAPGRQRAISLTTGRIQRKSVENIAPGRRPARLPIFFSE
jgi:hypothetical protein